MILFAQWGQGIQSDSPNILEEFSKTHLQRLALNCLAHGLFVNLLTSYNSRKPLKWTTRCIVPVEALLTDTDVTLMTKSSMNSGTRQILS